MALRQTPSKILNIFVWDSSSIPWCSFSKPVHILCWVSGGWSPSQLPSGKTWKVMFCFVFFFFNFITITQNPASLVAECQCCHRPYRRSQVWILVASGRASGVKLVPGFSCGPTLLWWLQTDSSQNGNLLQLHKKKGILLLACAYFTTNTQCCWFLEFES